MASKDAMVTSTAPTITRDSVAIDNNHPTSSVLRTCVREPVTSVGRKGVGVLKPPPPRIYQANSVDVEGTRPC